MRLNLPDGGRASPGPTPPNLHPARVGYSPNPLTFTTLTGASFGLCAELFGYPKRECRERAARMLALVRLEEKSWDKGLRKFSKGMLQRVGLAQALVNDPEIVFLDEPMSGLDPVGRREVRDLIAAQRERGATVFFSTHISPTPRRSATARPSSAAAGSRTPAH